MSIVELRQYTLVPGQRDVLIELFEREFVESQEALGMRVLGTFRDLDRADRFVWIRAFDDMASRRRGLEAFYSGPVWQAHRQAANATMIDSDNVLLLRPAAAGAAFLPADRRAPQGATATPPGLLVATIYSFAEPVEAELVDRFEREAALELAAAGVAVRAAYVTESSPNDYPRLPVRENEHTMVWFAVFPDAEAHARSLAKLAASGKWLEIAAELAKKLKAPPEVLRLQPTPRSALPSRADLAAAAGADDFDFLIGEWTVVHRRLKERLAGSNEWIELTGPASVRKILGGLGNVDEIGIDLPEGGYTGSTLRLFRPATGEWTIYWMDSRDPRLDPPMVGRFEDGRGLFYGDDSFAGKPIRVRFVWSPLSSTSCRWEQAFSTDGGKTWETNWTMSFTRVGLA